MKQQKNKEKRKIIRVYTDKITGALMANTIKITETEEK